MKFPAAFLVALAFCTQLHAEAVKDREGAVRGDRARMENDLRWIYNDVEAGFAQAARTGKPLLVVLRCVPCVACAGIDASILGSEELKPLLDQFVCVRVINANALDLRLFQFDYDLSFSTLFFNADRTLYGRFGSWQHQRDASDVSLASYRLALEGALGLHRTFPAIRPALASKQGVPVPFKEPVEFPTLAGKYERELNWQGKVVQSCVHCHQIGDAYRAWHRSRNLPLPLALIYPMPAPETLGLSLEGLAIKDVRPASPAAGAGFQTGDEVRAIDGTPLISTADFAWALDRAPDSGRLSLSIVRAGKALEIPLPLAPDWRRKTDISGRVATWPMRAMAAGGLVLRSIPEETRQERHLAPDALGLIVFGLGEYGPHGAAKKAGFQKGDVLLGLEGVSGVKTESELLGEILSRAPAKSGLKASVLRGEDRLDLVLPQQ